MAEEDTRSPRTREAAAAGVPSSQGVGLSSARKYEKRARTSTPRVIGRAEPRSRTPGRPAAEITVRLSRSAPGLAKQSATTRSSGALPEARLGRDRRAGVASGTLAGAA